MSRFTYCHTFCLLLSSASIEYYFPKTQCSFLSCSLYVLLWISEMLSFTKVNCSPHSRLASVDPLPERHFHMFKEHLVSHRACFHCAASRAHRKKTTYSSFLESLYHYGACYTKVLNTCLLNKVNL